MTKYGSTLYKHHLPKGTWVSATVSSLLARVSFSARYAMMSSSVEADPCGARPPEVSHFRRVAPQNVRKDEDNFTCCRNAVTLKQPVESPFESGVRIKLHAC